MNRIETLADHRRDSRRYLVRALFASVIVAAVLLLLFTRLYFLQVEEHDYYATASRSNRLRLEVLPPVRGTIVDRQGELLAVNVPAFSLSLVPEEIDNLDELLASLGELVDISPIDIERFSEQRTRSQPFDAVVLRGHLSEQELAILAVNSHRFKGLRLDAESVRSYPFGPLFAHLVGYVGRISEKDLQRVTMDRYRGTRFYGKSGIELVYESRLHGDNSFRIVERNARGRELRELQRGSPHEGDSIQLTVDVGLQQAAAAALGEQAGAIVAMEPATGAIRALVSWPAFDPNLFVRGISNKAYQELLHDPQRPLFNRATRGQYPPGSTLKPFVGFAGIEEKVDVASRIFCPGWFQLKGKERKYRCWKRHGHGPLELVGAITQSCDVFFYNLAVSLGIDRIHDHLSRFGFGAKTGLKLGSESTGLLPSTQWKRATVGEPWYLGETVISGIGQGYNSATVLQLARATAILALHGKDVRPHLIPGTNPSEKAVIQAPESSWNPIIEGMTAVVNGPRGTARAIGKNIDYKIAGKTGTAQVYQLSQDEDEKKNRGEIAKNLQDHALFIAFAPVENPQLVVAVIVENGGSGSGTAAPIARKLFDYYFANQ